MNSSLSDFIQQIEKYEEEIIEKIDKGAVEFHSIPEFLISQNVALNAVVRDMANFSRIPLSKLDNVVCLAACQLQIGKLAEIPSERSAWVNQNINSPLLSHILDKYKTDNLIFCFLKLHAENIKHLPKEKLGERKFLEKCCELNPLILTQIGSSYVDQELCNIAINSDKFTLECLPTEWQTIENCEKAFKKNYAEIINFPNELVDYSHVLEALEKCGESEAKNILNLLSEDEWDDNIIIKAVEKNESILTIVPTGKLTTELMFRLAPYLTRYEYLSNVPLTSFNKNLANRLVSCNPLLLGGIPTDLRDRVLCFEAVSKNGLALEFAPRLARTDEMFVMAVSQNGLALKHVPKPYRDENIPRIAVEQNGEALEYVPSNMVDEIICRVAVEKDAQAIYFVPNEYRSNELFEAALAKIPEVLKIIPADRRTVEQCVSAVEANPSLFDLIPLTLRADTRIKQIAKKLGYIKEEAGK